jgi:hypothetical protein
MNTLVALDEILDHDNVTFDRVGLHPTHVGFLRQYVASSVAEVDEYPVDAVAVTV